MWVSSAWSFDFDSALATASGTLHQVLSQSIASGRPYTLSFYKTGSRILQVALYQDTTPIQTLFESASPGDGAVEVSGTTSGAANRIYLQITNANATINTVDDLSLIV